ncbi:DUF1934 domain-containing protein [Alkalicella caledoniensis]|uniref:DUF1934 domain-containing protein n=1 Tax=Alkalicella caledoniensis TaxID=2731377 RepID=A0A7G9W8V7_ALKCA|nr:DUF1934 domain-containing protein [Alkalicella caledoniensis]QNO15119.1 DUF1934 domain-containing protein [Alkalicella caledoniensis]
MRPVQIIIKSSQQTPSGRSDMQIQVEGNLTNKNDTWYLTYKEPEGTGLDNTTTTLKLEDNKVTLLRSGYTKLKQVFVLGEITRSHYVTQYGSFEIEVDAKDIRVELLSDKGKIYLNYDLNMAGEKIEDQKLNIMFYSI